MKTLSYCNVKYTPRVPLILFRVKKVECENFDFVLLLSFFHLSSSFPSHITQKVYGVYKWSAYQTTALLPEIILFFIRAACELRSVSYGYTGRETVPYCFRTKIHSSYRLSRSPALSKKHFLFYGYHGTMGRFKIASYIYILSKSTVVFLK